MLKCLSGIIENNKLYDVLRKEYVCISMNEGKNLIFALNIRITTEAHSDLVKEGISHAIYPMKCL